jgi:biotin carboxyl carrier protein
MDKRETLMRFIAEVASKEIHLEVKKDLHTPLNYTGEIDGEPITFNAQVINKGHVSVIWKGRSYDVEVERTGDLSSSLDGRRAAKVVGRVVRFNMLDERRKKMRDATENTLGNSEGAKIESPMPGKVLRILVEQGCEVKSGQGIIVIEAMKMENILKTPSDGIVSNYYVQEGQTVSSGQLLATIEKITEHEDT